MVRRKALFVGVGAVIAFFGVMWALSLGGYPGGPDECIARGDCYCEAIGPGVDAQPANAWSNLGFVAVGLLVLGASGRRRSGSGRMSVDDRYPALYGAIAVFLGLGSFAFHGSMRAWGGFLDVQSMHAFLAFILAYDLARIHDGAWRWFLAWYATLLTFFTLLIALVPPEHGRTLFGVFVIVTLGVEAAVSYPALRPWAPRRLDPRRMPWFWAGLGSFAVAFVVWNLSRDAGPWCEPDSLLQGHALWHLLSAVSVVCFYRYFLGEGEPPAADQTSVSQSTATS
ncbi:MAG: ceramidase domain-containing protein [Acidimicrobiia bacterium]|nr:MAG: ceramidase domain-containing protein [Acidimicrobiia bacterium]